MASIYHPGFAQQLVSQGYFGYAGWGDDEAFADFQVTKGAGKGGSGQSAPAAGPQSAQVQDPQSSANQLIQSSLDRFTQLKEESVKRFGEFQKNNPFVLDDILAEKRGEATEQIDPYYNELKADYLLGIKRTRERGVQDTQQLLTDLNRVTETGQLKVDEAINRAREGFAEAGLFESGARLRAEGLGERGRLDFLAEQEGKGRGIEQRLGRGLEDIALEQRQKVRGLERERFTNIEELTGQLGKEAGQRYTTGFLATQPTELQAAGNNLDLLRQIGIYS